MTDAIAYRGPDSEGHWCDGEAGLALGHRRLAIIDTSSAGAQPMLSASGRFVLVYNGEIYNYRALRDELEAAGAAPPWRGHSDTEVMLAAFERWGIRGTLERLNGMFAIALWDRERRELVLARDRMGEKPLYYGTHGGTVLFGSDLKAIRQHPKFSPRLDRAALAHYFHYLYVPAPRSVWDGIAKLPPASFVVVSHGGQIGEPDRYWDIEAVAHAGRADPLPLGPVLTDQLDALLKDAVGLRMVADVPLGAFLSGGIDSTTVVALMQSQSTRPVKTFSIGFDDRAYDEAPFARTVAAHLGTEHSELYVGAQSVVEAIPRMGTIYDEPFADSSQVPTFLVSRMARQEVTVSLSGDGGDELFGGYNRYVGGYAAWQRAQRLPSALRSALAYGLARPEAGRAARLLSHWGPRRLRASAMNEKLLKLARLLAECTAGGMYRNAVRVGGDAGRVLLNSLGPKEVSEFEADWADPREAMMLADARTYLPDDILVKLDRASMAVSLEGRVPFLDHRIIEFSWRLPMEAKISGGIGKRILRDVLYRYVPPAMMERPKAGFAIPVGRWLASDLRDWVEDLLDARRMRDDGILDAGEVQRIWQRHLAEPNSPVTPLWGILMFQAWLRAQGSQTEYSALSLRPPIARHG